VSTTERHEHRDELVERLATAVESSERAPLPASAQREPARMSDYKIVVTGDVIAEAKLAMSQVRQSEQHTSPFDTASYMKRYSQAIGAASISEIIRRMLAGLPSIATERQRSVLLSLDSFEMFSENERYWTSYVVCEQVPKKPGSSGEPASKKLGSGGDVAWRITQRIGFDRKDPKDQLVDLSPSDDNDADLIIVNQSVGSEQAKFGFMGHEDKWPKSLRNPKDSAWLIIEWSRPRLEPPFSPNWERLLRRFDGRAVVILTIEDLRLAGARISRGISWERTLTDLFERIRDLWTCGRNAGPLCRCAHLVVSFGTSGAAIFTGPKERLRAKLIYDPRFLEGSWQEQYEGSMTGSTRCLTAGIALEMICAGRDFVHLTGAGAKAGVIAARRVLESGFTEIGREALHGTELPKDLRFPSSVAARVLRSAVAEQHIVGKVEKAATDLRTALCKMPSFANPATVVDAVRDNLEAQQGVHFDAVALGKEVLRIHRDWLDNDPVPSTAAKTDDEEIERTEQRRMRFVDRVMGFIAPDHDAIAEAKRLQDVSLDPRACLEGWSILEKALPKGVDGGQRPEVTLVDRIVSLVGIGGADAADGRTAGSSPDPARKILTECRKIVEYGDSNDLAFPTLRIGKLLVTSREELEGITAVREVIQSYVRGNVRTPLSIAVFGRPGSGKSFSIKELAKSISGGRYSRVEDRTFNLSQFSSPEALASALQQVRDLGLSGIMPLVFWDEFDTQYDGGMGWLRYFLAPMQDGKYQDGSAVYYVGRAIFVFAGGRHATMEEFVRRATPHGKRDAASVAEAVAAKLPDFVSRLQGFIDIPALDYKLERGSEGRIVIDAPTALRRAKLLRGILDDSDANLEETIPHDEGVFGATMRKRLNIDPGVLGAFLRVQGFRYGARSIDAIVKMSALTGKNRYDRSSLPPDDQLSIHVDAQAFVRLANAGWPSPIEPAVNGSR
jgi:hypothetical protein